MKKDKVVSFLLGCLFSFLLSLASTMWVVTAFRMQVDTALLTVFCFLAAVFCSACYSLPLGAVPLAAGALALGYLWHSGALVDGVEAVLNRLSRQYNSAYGWGIIRWGLRTADEMEPTILTVLCILAALTAMATAWSVCRRESPVLSVISILFVACCFVVNDTVPDTPWIFLLLLTVLLLIFTGTVRRQDEIEGNRLCLLLLPTVALGLLVLFATNPRDTYDRQKDAAQLTEKVLGSDYLQYLMSGINGESAGVSQEAVDLTVVGYRTAGEGRVMLVTAPFSGTLYLRSKAMDTYDGTSWSSSGMADLQWPSVGLEDGGEVVINTRFAHRMLYMPYYSKLSQQEDIAGGKYNDLSLTEYSFYCYRIREGVTPAMLAALSSHYYEPGSLSRYIHLDEATVKWATPVAEALTSGTTSVYEKAQLIASYVRNSAMYDLETARMPAREKNFAKWFLEESETGYCVHFATATTVLLQSLGIPARYVTGYTVSVQEGETVEVKSKQAHAWAEYWLPGFGWVVLESTPPEALPELTQPTQTATEPVAQQPTNDAASVATDPAATTAPTAGTQPSQNQLGQDSKRWKLVAAAVLWVAAAALLCAAVLLQRTLRLQARKKRIQSAQPNGRALLYWQETVRLSGFLGEEPDRTLLQLAEMAKFSQHTLTDDQLAQFTAWRGEAVARLKQHNIFRRIYYALILALY